MREITKVLSCKPRVAKTFSEIVECEDVDLVIEAASQEAVRQYAVRTLEAGKDLVVMSVGALVDARLRRICNFLLMILGHLLKLRLEGSSSPQSTLFQQQ